MFLNFLFSYLPFWSQQYSRVPTVESGKAGLRLEILISDGIVSEVSTVSYEAKTEGPAA